MDAEDWKEFKEQGKIIRRARLERHQKAIKSFANTHGLIYQEIQPWQLRLIKGKTRIDLFPMSKKYHNLYNNKRGKYRNLEGFLKSAFK